jgi:hypothetical protein
MQPVPSMSFANPHPAGLRLQQKLALALASVGLLLLLVTWAAGNAVAPVLVLTTALLTIAAGTVWYAYETFGKQAEGIRNNNVQFESISWRVSSSRAFMWCCTGTPST